MSTTRRASRQLARNRSRGQSIPLIALILLVVVAMVGLSVDVGNTFSQERRAVLAADSASLSAMREVNKRSTSNNQNVYDVVEKSLISNGMNLAAPNTARQPGQVSWKAFYLDRYGQPVTQMPLLKREASAIPADVAYVKVALDGEVGTYFARAVGRPDLPIAASSYAGVCPVSSGVYPIGVNKVLIDDVHGKFNPPSTTTTTTHGQSFDWKYTVLPESSPYKNKTMMRIPLHSKHPGSTGAGGNFGFLNWTSAPGSAPALANRLWFPGNLDQGYQEVPVSEVSTLSNFVPGWEPNGTLEIGDWIWGDNGLSNSASINGAFADHIDRGTQLILPIYDDNAALEVDEHGHPTSAGNGSNAKFKIVDLGLFVINAFSPHSENGYIELIYLGKPTPNQDVCNTTSIALPPHCCQLNGEVTIVPQYQLSSGSQKPVRYILVMDVSGSMAANFAGQCDYNKNDSSHPISPPKQCAVATDVNGTIIHSDLAGAGGQYRWSNLAQRRLGIAREAVKALINKVKMPGNTGWVAGSTADEIAILTFGSGAGWNRVARFNSNGNYIGGTADATEAFSSKPAGLVNAVDGLMPDNIVEQGQGTNAAAGLYQASLLLDGAPTRLDATNHAVTFKNVVILVTDGIANLQFHKDAPGQDEWFSQYTRFDWTDKGYTRTSEYPSDSQCYTLEARARAEYAECQQNDPIGWAAGVTPKTLNDNPAQDATLSRPMTQVGEVSQKFLKNIGDGGNPRAEVFVVGLSGASQAGQAAVVTGSTGSHFKLVTDPNLLDDTLLGIYGSENSGCQAPEAAPTNLFTSANIASSSTYGFPKVGEVKISGTPTGQTIPLSVPATSIRPADGTNVLSYSFAEIPPGQYTLTANVWYHYPGDTYLQGRFYDTFPSGLVTSPSVTVSEPQNRYDLMLRLHGGQICPTTP